MHDIDSTGWPDPPADLLSTPGVLHPPVPLLTAEEVFGAGGLLSQKLPAYQSRESQLVMAQEIEQALENGRSLMVEAPTGCHAAGQGILLHDGSIKRVEDVRVGDILQGPDGPRQVLGLARGRQQMADIVPVKGSKWRVNLDHILTLVRIDTNQVMDVSVKEYLGWSKWMKSIHKLFRAPAEFRPSSAGLPLDPYFLGVLLGDGSLSVPRVAITKPDPEIAELAQAEAARWGLEYKLSQAKNLHQIVGPVGIKHHPIIDHLRSLGLTPISSCDRFVPRAYKVAARQDRLAILAGLIDTDGHLEHTCYDFISASPQLAADVVFLARSIGLAAYSTITIKGFNGKDDVYYRVSISGNTNLIPCRIPRKQAPPRRQIKDALRTGFTVEFAGVEDYYGFTLDGDGRYLLDDFTVTHNTGKSLGYSVPAIMHAMATGQHVLIATANIALQEQLVQKDLPFLQSVLPVPFQFALLKGRSNFVCNSLLQEQSSMLFAGVAAEDQAEFDRVLTWASRTATGDASELPFKVTPRVWRHFAVSDTSECAGCKLKCFHKVAVTEASDAHVVVCNYHLLFAHLKVKAATGGMAGVLPEFHVLICDEAHEIPDIGTDFAGEEIGRWSFRGFKRHLSRAGYEALDLAAEELSKAIRMMGFRHAAPGSGRIKLPGLIDEEPARQALRRAFKELRASQAQFEEESKEYIQLERQKEQCRRLGGQVKALIWQDYPEWVYWVERQDGASGESWKLKGKPVSIAPFLRQHLLPWIPVIATSATLTTTREDFTFIRERIGLDPATRQIVLPSPFDFNTSALLVVPEGLPDPTDPAHRDRVHNDLFEAIQASEGRALLLFTSSQALRTAYGLLAPEFDRLGHRCFCQGDAPSTQLIAQFKEDVSSVLFATRTFFQGIDVPGESLSLVALDRLPFPSPADPVMDYIAEHDPKGWFFKHSLPTALIAWRQIFGRLIRRHDDRGVVLLLDGRVQSKKYGKQFLRAIPGGMLSHEVAAIESFLADPEDPFA